MAFQKSTVGIHRDVETTIHSEVLPMFRKQDGAALPFTWWIYVCHDFKEEIHPLETAIIMIISGHDSIAVTHIQYFHFIRCIP